MGKRAVLELRLQSCIYKQCTHKLLRDIFKTVLVGVFTPSIDDTLAFGESRTRLLD